MKIMVAYDGTMQAKDALVYGMEKAREEGGEVIIVHVFNRGMFIDYDAHVDAENAARREYARFMEEAKTIISEKGKGVRVRLYSTDGNPEEEVIGFAKEMKADVLLCPPRFKAIISKYRRALGVSEFSGGTAKLNLAALPAKAL